MYFARDFPCESNFPVSARPVTGSTKEIGRAIAETLAANGAAVAIDGRNKADDVALVIGEIRGTVPSGRLLRASGDAACEADILFKNVGT